MLSLFIFHITIVLNTITDIWLVSISFSILSEDSSFPLDWGLFLCLPIICGTLLVCFCFLNLSILTIWLCDVNFYDGRSVRFSGSVSLIIWTGWFWDALDAFYADSLDVIGFWLLLGISLVGPSLQLFDWGSILPPHLVCCCAGVAWSKPQSWRSKPTLANKPLPP